MRQVVLDTETTGLEWRNGDRVIEIGCVELLNRKLSGRHYHVYINPERRVDPGAMAIHGISDEFLEDKPKFREIADEFADFIAGAELVIHNAPFDVGFLNMEFEKLDRPKIDTLCGGVIDTLRMAKEQNPGKKASLDALCQRHEIDNAHRTLHGALLDSELLAEVYLAMTRGQDSLIMELEIEPPSASGEEGETCVRERKPLKVLRASADEVALHDETLAGIAKANKGKCLWLPEQS
ncbi:MAG: DNA polymerase III subunit epsilon [Betaproteobacteria bacterium]|nr:DNA polymerase III subunit epsilon [Betaproteobacteria bacterium]